MRKHLFSLYFAADRVRSNAVSVYVCLSDRSHISKTTCPYFTKFSVHVSCARGSAIFWRQWNTLLFPVLWMTSCFQIMENIEMAHFYHSLIAFARGRQQCTCSCEETTDCAKAYAAAVVNITFTNYCGRGQSLLSSVVLLFISMYFNNYNGNCVSLFHVQYEYTHTIAN